MADDKRNRGDQQPTGGDQGTDRQRNKDRKPGSGSMESPESTRTRREDEQEPQE
jgi:hypothetical protein